MSETAGKQTSTHDERHAPISTDIIPTRTHADDAAADANPSAAGSASASTPKVAPPNTTLILGDYDGCLVDCLILNKKGDVIGIHWHHPFITDLMQRLEKGENIIFAMGTNRQNDGTDDLNHNDKGNGFARHNFPALILAIQARMRAITDLNGTPFGTLTYDASRLCDQPFLGPDYNCFSNKTDLIIMRIHEMTEKYGTGLNFVFIDDLSCPTPEEFKHYLNQNGLTDCYLEELWDRYYNCTKELDLMQPLQEFLNTNSYLLPECTLTFQPYFKIGMERLIRNMKRFRQHIAQSIFAEIEDQRQDLLSQLHKAAKELSGAASQAQTCTTQKDIDALNTQMVTRQKTLQSLQQQIDSKSNEKDALLQEKLTSYPFLKPGDIVAQSTDGKPLTEPSRPQDANPADQFLLCKPLPTITGTGKYVPLTNWHRLFLTLVELFEEKNICLSYSNTLTEEAGAALLELYGKIPPISQLMKSMSTTSHDPSLSQTWKTHTLFRQAGHLAAIECNILIAKTESLLNNTLGLALPTELKTDIQTAREQLKQLHNLLPQKAKNNPCRPRPDPDSIINICSLKQSLETQLEKINSSADRVGIDLCASGANSRRLS